MHELKREMGKRFFFMRLDSMIETLQNLHRRRHCIEICHAQSYVVQCSCQNFFLWIEILHNPYENHHTTIQISSSF
jgi:hypothetical protein